MEDVKKEVILLHLIKWGIGIYFVETNVMYMCTQQHMYFKKNLNT
jgi:hypothetical protein